MKKSAIISGISGQDGAYLSKLLLDKGYQVIGLIRGFDCTNFGKLKFVNIYSNIIFEECDLLDITQVLHILRKYKPSEFYNLAAQSSVSKSFLHPINTIEFNTISVLNILESIRMVDKSIKFYQASSSEMFGKGNDLPINEKTSLHPLSPYAISKATGHWTTIHYRESYDIFACCGVLFNHESYLRSHNFFVKKVIVESLNIKYGKADNLRVGNIDIKRDFGYAPKYVEAIWVMLQQQIPEDYIICSGKSIQLKDIILYIFQKLDIPISKLVIDKELYRPTDIEDIFGDNRKAKEKLNWEYNHSFFEVLDWLLEEEEINSFNN